MRSGLGLARQLQSVTQNGRGAEVADMAKNKGLGLGVRKIGVPPFKGTLPERVLARNAVPSDPASVNGEFDGKPSKQLIERMVRVPVSVL